MDLSVCGRGRELQRLCRHDLDTRGTGRLPWPREVDLPKAPKHQIPQQLQVKAFRSEVQRRYSVAARGPIQPFPQGSKASPDMLRTYAAQL